jgi:dTDP-glucose 4,6-dehydratase
MIEYIDEDFDFFKEEFKTEKNLSKILLVTGGAGFIGANFITYILENYPEYRVINFDKLTYAGNLNNLTFIENNPNYVFMKGDIANKKDVKNVYEEFNPDFVVHFAAESHVDRSIINPDIFLQTNVIGTQNLLNFAREHKIEKFILISTDEVYGSVEKGHSSLETDRMGPNNPYSASKAAAEFLIRVAHQTYGQRVNVIRSCNNYGRYQFPEKLIPMIICNAIKDKPIPIYGDGKNSRSWLNVQDHCAAIDAVLHTGKTGEIYNVAAKNEISNIDLAEKILKKMEKSLDLIEFVFDRPGHDKRYSMNANKIHNQLGWSPKVNFDDGLAQTIEWYITHQDWIDNVLSGEYMNYYQKKMEQI